MSVPRPSYEELHLSPREGDRWVLLREWRYVTQRGEWIVPGGFTTDLTSSPRFLWAFVPPFGPYMGAAVLHDFLYASKVMPRKDADRLFLAAMIVDGERTWRAHILYLAVRWFGWLAWRRK